VVLWNYQLRLQKPALQPSVLKTPGDGGARKAHHGGYSIVAHLEVDGVVGGDQALEIHIAGSLTDQLVIP